MITKKQIDEVYRRRDEFGLTDDKVARERFAEKCLAEIDLTKLNNQFHILMSYYGSTNPFSTNMSGDREGRPPITQAWEAEAERLSYVLLVARPQVKLELGLPHHDEDGRDYDNTSITSMWMRYALFNRMLAAVPYLWRTEIMTKAEMMPIPRHTIPESLLPYPYMYWSWQTGFTHKVMNRETGEQWQCFSDGLLIYYAPPDYIHACLIGEPPGTYEQHFENPTVSLYEIASIRIGSTWPDDFDKDEQFSIAPILTKLAFLNSQYISSEPQRLPRPIRRALARASVADPDPVIHVVSLRPSTTPSSVGGASERKFHHQWWVRGHIRAQWHPSIKGHKLIWIDEHLKGPNDAPMISKIYDVNR